MLAPSIFRPYNIRGVYPSEFDEGGAYIVAQAFADVLKPQKVAVGRDARLSGPKLQDAVIHGFTDAGVDVVDLGMITTDQLYWVAGSRGLDGIQVSASHNPPEWNGIKFIKKGVVPLSDNELAALYQKAREGRKRTLGAKGRSEKLNLLPEYTSFLLRLVDSKTAKAFRVVANPLNGTAGPLVEALTKHLPIELVGLNMEPDGRFPKGNPDPFSPEMRTETSQEVRANRADLGVSWDNDADRIVFFDESGGYVPGVFVTALLARRFLEKYPGAKIVSDVRVVWPVKEVVEVAGGIYLENKPGHVFFKARMAEENSFFGGEQSGHFFFKDFWYADNGFIPFLLMLQILSGSKTKLSNLVAPFREKYFFSEEINFPLETMEAAGSILSKASEHYKDGKQDHISGISIEYPEWRLNLRPSDNEPKIRLTVEARSQKLLDEKTTEVTNFVKGLV